MDDRQRIGLVLRRAGFGLRPGDLERYTDLGWDGTLDELLNPPATADQPLDGLLTTLESGLLDLQNLEDVQTWWLYRMLQTARPLQEKLTLFWHGHFAVANYKVNNPLLMHQHIELLRGGALGRFDDLLLSVSRDPAMLLWLDGATNRKGAPNENYGRELLELYTLGIGNYTEDDVKSAARAFSGWNLRNGNQFYFDSGQHDGAVKAFLGQSGELDGSDVLSIVADHPATANRIASKLFQFFAYAGPDTATIAPFARTYLDSGHDIRAVVEAILRSDHFVSDRSVYEHVKSPIDYIVGSLRMLGATIRERELVTVLRQLGQEILNPPNVAGWPGGLNWINPSTLLTRYNFASRIAFAQGGPGDGGGIDPQHLLGETTLENAGEVLDNALTALGNLSLSPDAHQVLMEYVQSPLTYPPGFNGKPNPAQQQVATDGRLRGMLLLALASSDYQVG
ncbi:MAG: DUF1800 domain-containing protein [Chloroflexota bacterium]